MITKTYEFTYGSWEDAIKGLNGLTAKHRHTDTVHDVTLQSYVTPKGDREVVLLLVLEEIEKNVA